MVRLSQGPDEDISDGFYPKEDYGYLCFRFVEAWKSWAVSGCIKDTLVSDEAGLNTILDTVASLVLNTNEGMFTAVEIVSADYVLIRSGEENFFRQRFSPKAAGQGKTLI